MDNSVEIFEIFRGIICDLAPLVLLEKSRINLLLRRLELGAHVVLFADENELARRGRIVVAQEVMHPEPKVLEAKLGEVVAIDRVRIEIVFLQAATIAPALLVFSPGKTNGEEKHGGDDRGDDVDRKIAAKAAKNRAHRHHSGAHSR